MPDKKQEPTQEEEPAKKKVVITHSQWTPDHPRLPEGLTIISLFSDGGRREKKKSEESDA